MGHASSSSNVDLAICSVSFHNALHLHLNWELTKHLNEGSGSCKWIIAENTQDDCQDRLRDDDERFQVISGIHGACGPNYQHTEALHKCFTYADTRFMLILDPDFYIVRKDWIKEILDYMQEIDLSFFGVPWHPKYSDKYRYFPCVHCLFVDLAKIRLDDLDLRPTRLDEPIGVWHGQTVSSGTRPSYLRRYTTKVFDAFTLQARRKHFTDTGTRLYHRFAKDSQIRYECAIPVFRLPADAPMAQSRRSRWLEKILPDQLCYLPKRADTFTTVGFRELGYLTGAPKHWEEFMWRDAPFGFHVRRNAAKARRNAEAELKVLEHYVQDFYAKRETDDQS